MAVLTAPYWHGTPVRLPTKKLWCKTTNIDICCEGYHKRLCLGSSRKQAHWQGLGLHTKTPKMKSRAAKGGGFGGSADSVNDEDNDVDKDDDDDDEEEEEEKNTSFWEKKETKQKMKDLEEMSDLIKEAEKLQEGDVQAHEEGEASKEEEEEESEEDKRKKLREELAKRAREQAEKRKTAEIMFQMGQRAYGKGMYNKAVDLLEGALSNVPKVSLVGGEIQLWLAMAYEAHYRHDDCIALCKSLEKIHPIRAVRQKAADLRYILEAPKLKITEEERVSIPLIDYDSNYDSSKRSWSQMYRNRRKAAVNKGTPPMRDYFQDFLVWKRPKWERSPLFWVVVAGWLTLVGVALVFQD